MDKWYVYAKRADFKRISEKFGIDPVVARVLRNRDIITDEEIDYFLHGTLDNLYDEKLIPDMEKAADAVALAIKKRAFIRIVGDYDIDGVCSTYILCRALKDIGGRVDYRIPDRINDGYGINMRIIEEAYNDGIEFILTCDNGIAALDEMERAAELGLQVVITDHHSVRTDDNGNDILPRALAVVDVKRSGSRYPTDETCGAVTAWKLIRQIYMRFGIDDNAWLKYLDFAAIATVGDIMKLTGENRIIVREGLKSINSGPSNLGLATLISELQLTDKAVDTYHIGFIIGPCINAGGRLETAESAMKLFLAADRQEALLLAKHLIYLNTERKSMTEEGTRKGIGIVEASMANDKVLVVYIEGLHESLAGIVAGRLKEHFCRPCFVITDAREGLKGSGRSIEAYDMFAAICSAGHLLTKYGGHPMAAGLSLKSENLEGFRIFLNENSGLNDEDFVKKLWIDDPTPLGYISEGFINQLDMLAPYGSGFEKPLFAARNITVLDTRVMGKKANALRLTMADGKKNLYNGIFFGDAAAVQQEIRGRCIDIVYSPTINTWRGVKSIQIEVRQYRIRQ